MTKHAFRKMWPDNALFGVVCLRQNAKAWLCVLTSPISACSAMSSRPAASPMAPSAPIWRWRSLDPHPQHGGGARRAAADPRPAGRDADAGRPDPAAARPHDPGAGRTPARGPRRLCRRAGRPGAGSVQHQCADRVPARGAELVPRRASACQHRSRGAAERRDRRPDRRRRRRYRHRRRHGRCRPADDLSRSAATASCSWSRATIRWRSRRKIGFAEVLDYDFVGLDRASALQRFLAEQGEPHRPAAAAARAAAQLRRGVPPGRSAMSASASCRKPRRSARRNPWRSRWST